MPGFIPGFIQPSCKLPVLIHCLQVAAVVTGEVEEDFRPRRSGWPWWGLIGNAAVISVPLLIWVAYRRVFSTPVQVSTGGAPMRSRRTASPSPSRYPDPSVAIPARLQWSASGGSVSSSRRSSPGPTVEPKDSEVGSRHSCLRL